MKAWVCKSRGLDHLKVEENIPIPEPQEGEILIRHHAVALNHIDYKALECDTTSFPYIPGIDICGIVYQTGPAVTNFTKSDVVLVHGDVEKKMNGGFAEYSVQDESTALNLSTLFPEKTSKQLLDRAVELASMPCAGWTAYYALLRKLKIKRNERIKNIFITDVCGDVGGFAAQICKAKRPDINVIGTCSEKNKYFAKSYGVDVCIDSTKSNIHEEIKKLTNDIGIDAWVDTIGDESCNGALNCLKFGGELACIGGNVTKINLAFEKSISVHQVFLGGVYQTLKDDIRSRNELVDVGGDMCQLYFENKIKPMVTQEIKFEDAKDALESLKRGNVKGKIVLDYLI